MVRRKDRSNAVEEDVDDGFQASATLKAGRKEKPTFDRASSVSRGRRFREDGFPQVSGEIPVDKYRSGLGPSTPACLAEQRDRQRDVNSIYACSTRRKNDASDQRVLPGRGEVSTEADNGGAVACGGQTQRTWALGDPSCWSRGPPAKTLPRSGTGGCLIFCEASARV